MRARDCPRGHGATLRRVIVRTSATDPIRVDWIAGLDGAGAVGLTFAPGKRAVGAYSGIRWERDLDADLERLRHVEGADVLVTLMEPHELAHHGIATLPDRARAHGLMWRTLPIRDGSVPSSGWALAALLAQLRAAGDQRVVVHCLGGLGRAGLVVGCHLVGLGWRPDRALAALRAARGPNCPEMRAQVAYIQAWAHAKAVA